MNATALNNIKGNNRMENKLLKYYFTILVNLFVFIGFFFTFQSNIVVLEIGN